MKLITCIIISSVFCIAAASQASEQKVDLGNVTGGDFKRAHAIIDQKCTVCHSKDKIDIALASGKDMNSIQKEMEIKGARLNSNERDVLGIFWKKSRPITKEL